MEQLYHCSVEKEWNSFIIVLLRRNGAAFLVVSKWQERERKKSSVEKDSAL
jgi:hypothetical protein